MDWQTREVTDKFMVEVEMDRRCYEELLGERKDMELAYEERLTQLQETHSEVGGFPSLCRTVPMPLNIQNTNCCIP